MFAALVAVKGQVAELAPGAAQWVRLAGWQHAHMYFYSLCDLRCSKAYRQGPVPKPSHKRQVSTYGIPAAA